MELFQIFMEQENVINKKSHKSWTNIVEEGMDKDATLCDGVEQKQTELDHSGSIEVGDDCSARDSEQ